MEYKLSNLVSLKKHYVKSLIFWILYYISLLNIGQRLCLDRDGLCVQQSHILEFPRMD